MDLNGGLRQSDDGNVAGEYGVGNPCPASAAIRPVLQAWDLSAANSFFPNVAYHVGETGESHIDHVVVPRGLLPAVESCQVHARSVRRLRDEHGIDVRQVALTGFVYDIANKVLEIGKRGAIQQLSAGSASENKAVSGGMGEVGAVRNVSKQENVVYLAAMGAHNLT
eukprot:7992465-Pyramimonas_sp.AAC.1